MNLSSTNFIGLGVADNFTGHLEQAGEASDSVVVEAVQGAPKGIFPYYLSKLDSFLSVNPLSSDKIYLPVKNSDKVQIEPEVALWCQLEYSQGRVTSIQPRSFTAFNDCSIRIKAPKISFKKNWGKASQGYSTNFIDIDNFKSGGVLDKYRISSFLKRNGKVYEYGVDSQVNGYSYFYSNLIDWLINRMNKQSAIGPLESISGLLREAHYPRQAFITVGATRYTKFGESTYLQEKDEIYVVLYPSLEISNKQISNAILNDVDTLINNNKISVLHQQVIGYNLK